MTLTVLTNLAPSCIYASLNLLHDSHIWIRKEVKPKHVRLVIWVFSIANETERCIDRCWSAICNNHGPHSGNTSRKDICEKYICTSSVLLNWTQQFAANGFMNDSHRNSHCSCFMNKAPCVRPRELKEDQINLKLGFISIYHHLLPGL